MVKLNKIYTRTGDDGSTGLVNGARRSKCDLRVEADGAVDETNATIGLARLFVKKKIDNMLEGIQNDLFDLGADLATPSDKIDSPALRINKQQVDWLETSIDNLNRKLEPLTSFVLPGGTQASAYLHLGRTISRRAERKIVALGLKEEVNPDSLRYINRLSDFLFVAARYANHKGQNDILWIPGKNRKANP